MAKLKQGTNTFKIRAVDIAANWGSTINTSVLVDTIGPGVGAGTDWSSETPTLSGTNNWFGKHDSTGTWGASSTSGGFSYAIKGKDAASYAAWAAATTETPWIGRHHLGIDLDISDSSALSQLTSDCSIKVKVYVKDKNIEVTGAEGDCSGISRADGGSRAEAEGGTAPLGYRFKFGGTLDASWTNGIADGTEEAAIVTAFDSSTQANAYSNVAFPIETNGTSKFSQGATYVQFSARDGAGNWGYLPGSTAQSSSDGGPKVRVDVEGPTFPVAESFSYTGAITTAVPSRSNWVNASGPISFTANWSDSQSGWNTGTSHSGNYINRVVVQHEGQGAGTNIVDLSTQGELGANTVAVTSSFTTSAQSHLFPDTDNQLGNITAGSSTLFVSFTGLDVAGNYNIVSNGGMVYRDVTSPTILATDCVPLAGNQNNSTATAPNWINYDSTFRPYIRAYDRHSGIDPQKCFWVWYDHGSQLWRGGTNGTTTVSTTNLTLTTRWAITDNTFSGSANWNSISSNAANWSQLKAISSTTSANTITDIVGEAYFYVATGPSTAPVSADIAALSGGTYDDTGTSAIQPMLRFLITDDAGNCSGLQFVYGNDITDPTVAITARDSSGGTVLSSTDATDIVPATWQTDRDPYFEWSTVDSGSGIDGFSIDLIEPGETDVDPDTTIDYQESVTVWDIGSSGIPQQS